MNELISEAGPISQLYSELISGHPILVYLALLAVPFTWWLLFRTRFGLRLRAVGENPAAVDTAGVSVVALRYVAVGICGILCGIAGAYLSTALQAGFVKDMSAGRGFIALAALIFAKWRPWHALYATLLFGLFGALEHPSSAVHVQSHHALAVVWIPRYGAGQMQDLGTSIHGPAQLVAGRDVAADERYPLKLSEHWRPRTGDDAAGRARWRGWPTPGGRSGPPFPSHPWTREPSMDRARRTRR